LRFATIPFSAAAQTSDVGPYVLARLLNRPCNKLLGNCSTAYPDNQNHAHNSTHSGNLFVVHIPNPVFGDIANTQADSYDYRSRAKKPKNRVKKPKNWLTKKNGHDNI